MCRLGDGPPGTWAGPSRRDWTKQGSWVPGLTLERAENGERTIMYCVPVGASRRLRWGCLEPRRHRRNARGHHRSRRRAPAPQALHGKLTSISETTTRPTPPSWSTPTTARCCMRPPRRAAPPGLADQDHDALSAVRASGVRQDRARHADGGVRGRLEPGADQARSAAGRHASRSRTRSRALSPSRPTTPRW